MCIPANVQMQCTLINGDNKADQFVLNLELAELRKFMMLKMSPLF